MLRKFASNCFSNSPFVADSLIVFEETNWFQWRMFCLSYIYCKYQAIKWPKTPQANIRGFFSLRGTSVSVSDSNRSITNEASIRKPTQLTWVIVRLTLWWSRGLCIWKIVRILNWCTRQKKRKKCSFAYHWYLISDIFSIKCSQIVHVAI